MSSSPSTSPSRARPHKAAREWSIAAANGVIQSALSIFSPSKRRPERFERAAELIANVRERKLSYCGPPKLENIAEAIEDMCRRKVAGCFVEAGCALGGSAIVIGKLKPISTPLYVFDVFGMIPPPSGNDGPDCHSRYEEIKSGRSDGIRGDTYYGYVPNLRAVVEENLRSFGLDLESQKIQLIQGLFQDTLHLDEPVAFAHIDCDWHDAVHVCIERLAPRIVIGGKIIFDDYSSYSGCRRAVDTWLAQTSAFRLARVERSATVERLS